MWNHFSFKQTKLDVEFPTLLQKFIKQNSAGILSINLYCTLETRLRKMISFICYFFLEPSKNTVINAGISLCFMCGKLRVNFVTITFLQQVASDFSYSWYRAIVNSHSCSIGLLRNGI